MITLTESLISEITRKIKRILIGGPDQKEELGKLGNHLVNDYLLINKKKFEARVEVLVQEYSKDEIERAKKEYAEQKVKNDEELNSTINSIRQEQRYYAVYDAKSEFKKEFIDLWQDKLKATLGKTIDSFDLKKMLETFFARHPWLLSEAENNETPVEIVLKFLEDDLYYRLLSNHDEKTFENEVIDEENKSVTKQICNNLLQALIKEKNIQWEKIKDEEISLICSQFIYNNFEFIAANRGAISYVNVSYPLYAYPNRYVNPNSNFHRMDLLKYLYKMLPENYRDELVYKDKPYIMNGAEKVPTSFKFDVMNLDDYERMHQVQKSFLGVALVNIATYDSPVWVVFEKRDKQQRVYHSERMTGIQCQKVQEMFQNFGKVIVEEVDCSDNIYTNDLKLDDKIAWNTIVLARIFPFCFNRATKDIKDFKVNSLSEYRKTVPISYFYQWVISTIIERPNNIFSGPDQIFRYRFPFTNKNVIELNDDLKSKSSQYSYGSSKIVGDNELISKEMSSWLQRTDDAEFAMNSFDVDKTISIDKELKKISLLLNNNSLFSRLILYVMKIIYHSENKLSCLDITLVDSYSDIEFDSNLDNRQSVLNVVFDHDTYIRKVTTRDNRDDIKPNLRSVLSYSSSCAARNRFLEVIEPNTLSDQNWNFRPHLWKKVGNLVEAFFKVKNYVLTLDEILRLCELNKEWRKNFCDQSFRKTFNDEKLWAFSQLSQMGTKGLDVFFDRFEESYKFKDVYSSDISPAFNATFDLNGNIYEGPESYIKKLTDRIENFLRETTIKKACVPLFSSLSVIMPDIFSSKVKDETINLIKILNLRKFTYPDELAKISLYNIAISCDRCGDFLDKLYNMAFSGDLRILIEVPEWERSVFVDDKERKLKDKYKIIQNKILDNQRKACSGELSSNLSSFRSYRAGTLKPQQILDKTIKQYTQPWGLVEADKRYPLATQTPGIQQQLQQQVEKGFQAQQEQEQEQEQEEEQQQEISTYKADEGDLITRYNVDSVYSKNPELYEKFKRILSEKFNYQNKNFLQEAFSLLVGSKLDAENVIEKMQPDAFEKMIEYIDYFRMGINKDTLPPGFSLAYSAKSKSLILCFDEIKQNKDLASRESLKIAKRNPFTVILRKAKKKVTISGDYRQYSLLIPTYDNYLNHEKRIGFCRFLSEIEQDSKKEENESKFLTQRNLVKNPDSRVNSLVVDRWTAEGNLVQHVPTMQECLANLSAWALSNGISSGLSDLYFKRNNDLQWSTKNLLSFGQLFNQYQTTGSSAAETFLIISDQILIKFGNEALTIWKKRFLDVSENWSELISANEIDAISLSLFHLGADSNDDQENKKQYARLWWKFVDTHGQAVGYMHYADLWYAFSKFMFYANNRKLTLDEEAFSRFFKDNKLFNGQVFLDRLCTVLVKSAYHIDSHDIQNAILRKIDKIDWTHNGFYYASRYQAYPYWDEDLLLSNLNSCLKLTPPPATYYPRWGLNYGESKAISNPKVLAWRFACQKQRLSLHDFEKLKALLKEFNPPQDEIIFASQFLKLIMLTLSIGVDRLENFDSVKLNEFYNRFKSLEYSYRQYLDYLNLDAEIIPFTLMASLSDLIILGEFVTSLNDLDRDNFKRYILSPTDDRVLVLNSLAHVIQYAKKAQIEISDLLRKVSELVILPCNDQALAVKIKAYKVIFCLGAYPWLIQKWSHEKDPFYQGIISIEHEPRRYELEYFREQLASINFEDSNLDSLPSAEELPIYFKAISRGGAVARKIFITNLSQKGIAIRLKDTAYRPLNEIEKKAALMFVTTKFKNHYRESNLKLFKKLLDNLAVKSIGDSKSQLDPLISLIISIDNKDYFNEVGGILGLLVSSLKEKKQCYFSTNKLKEILDSLWDKAHQELHYPVYLLKEVINHELKNKSSNLVNDQLDLLDVTTQSVLNRQNISSVVESSFSNQTKTVLIKLILSKRQSLFNSVFHCLTEMNKSKAGESWENAFSSIVLWLLENDMQDVECRDMLSLFSNLLDNTEKDEHLNKLWKEVNIKLSQLFLQSYQNGRAVNNYINFKNIILDKFSRNDLQYQYIKMIVVKVVDKFNEGDEVWAQLSTVIYNLSYWNIYKLKSLALYYRSASTPTLSELVELSRFSNYKVEDIIDHFERVMRAGDKRNWSLSEKDEKDLKRIISRIKQKGKGVIGLSIQSELLNSIYYLNHYSQVSNLASLKMTDLYNQLMSERDTLRDGDCKATARVLACMREILLRKTGKWVNHTQMLDLIYAALYNDQSLLHQVQTGEGKSIITVMRTAYLALTGHVVDVFSAKASLSKRDHHEFSDVLDAMKISHAYITADSPASAYQTRSLTNGVGAINYATPGNFSLFHAGHVWKNEEPHISLKPVKRVAFLDECDSILKRENTQFNYSDSVDAEAMYNLDEWIYDIVLTFYNENKDSFINQNGLFVTESHLRELYDLINSKMGTGPRQSSFFVKHFVRGKMDELEFSELRNQKLKELLSAAHAATQLTDGIHFSVMFEERKLASNLRIPTRFAKVMIANQIYHGSTYSDLVHQFLHVRLNKEAVERGETPDFFVEPYSWIALSQNVHSILDNYYSKIEGCSGTAASNDDLPNYESQYRIKHVVKLPTHIEKRTEFLPTIFADDEDAQVNAIVDVIFKNAIRRPPILIACEDDVHVKRLSSKIKDELKRRNFRYDEQLFTIDTNDTGLSEADVLPKTGNLGAITFSARMGVGTDIKPKTEDGLMVLRAYAGAPELVKQERGRQGRNGAKGTCQDIINFKAISDYFDRYDKKEESVIGARLQEICSTEKRHLIVKIEKHRGNNSSKWEWLFKAPEQADIIKYLKTRSVIQLKLEIKRNKEKYMRQKEDLIAVLSTYVMDALSSYSYSKQIQVADNLRQKWKICRQAIETAWNVRLNGRPHDSDEIYNTFLEKAKIAWNVLRLQFPYEIKLFPSTTYTVRTIEEEINDKMAIWTTPDSHQSLKSQKDIDTRWVRGLLKKYHYDKFDGRGHSEEESAKANKIVLKLIELLKIIQEKDPFIEGDTSTSQKESVTSMTHAQREEDKKQEPSLASQHTVVVYHESMVKAAEQDLFINFYQHCLKQCQRYHFNSLYNGDSVESVYGERYKEMNNLYGHLLSLSRNNKLTYKQKKTIFDKLYELLKNPKLYCLPFHAISHLISTVVNEKDQAIIGKYFSVADYFFTYKWFKEDLFSRNQGKEIAEYGKWFELLISISHHHYDDKSNNFFDGLIRVLKHDYKFEFDSIKFYLESLFASSSKITELMTWGAGENDIRYFIQLCKESSSPDKIRQSLQFLSSCPDFLFSKKDKDGFKALRPLMTIAFNWKSNFFPSFEALKKTPRERLNLIIEFFSKRNFDLESRESVEKFIEKLVLNNKSNIFFNEIMRELNNLPRVVSLTYLLKNFTSHVGTHYSEDAQKELSEIKQASESFEKFIGKRGITLEHKDYRAFSSNFSKLPVVVAKNLFGFLSEHDEVSTDAILSVLNAIAPSLLDHQSMIHFFSAIIKIKYKKEELSDFCHFYSKHLNYSEEDFVHSFKIFREATELSENRNYDDYFGNVDAPNASGRADIMRYLVQDELPSTISDRLKGWGDVFSKYDCLAKNLIKKISDTSKTHQQRSRDLPHYFRELGVFVSELESVAVPLSSSPVKASSLNLRSVSEQDLSEFISAKKAKYASFWWVNRERKDQADKLFNHFNASQFSSVLDLQNSIRHVVDVQRTILTSDEETKRNKKGYSRLYDISTEVFIGLATMYIKSNASEDNVSLSSKLEFIKVMLNNQWSMNVDSFFFRLPVNLKDQFNPLMHELLVDRKVNPAILSRFLDQHEKKIPSYLRFLMTNLKALAALSSDIKKMTPGSSPKI